MAKKKDTVNQVEASDFVNITIIGDQARWVENKNLGAQLHMYQYSNETIFERCCQVAECAQHTFSFVYARFYKKREQTHNK